MNPITYYHQQCANGLIIEDAQQLTVLHQLQPIFVACIKENKKRHKLLSKLRKPKPLSGFYMWGGVGIGKTLIMDCFFHCLPFPQKLRMHFHHFMRMVHHELKLHQGKKDPLKIIAAELVKKYTVLCFDEFFVADITDAMLLGRLFEMLFADGICLITTSNVAPDNLYRNGLQRDRFLPAIDAIKKQCFVLHIPTAIDYRLQHFKNAGIFYTPNDPTAHRNMEKSFDLISVGHDKTYQPINICGRPIPIVKQAGDTIWFDFLILCSPPRSQQDYMALAEQYNTVFISDIPVLSMDEKDKVTLFMHLVDVFYDAHIRLVISAATTIDKLYRSGHAEFAFARTRSRLIEMQSEAYFTAVIPRIF